MPKIRVWKLGSLEHKILPTSEAIRQLAELLCKRDENKDFDIIWGPDLEVIDFDTEGEMSIVTGPDIRVTKEGNVIKIEKES